MSDTLVLVAHLPMPRTELLAFLERRPSGKRLVHRVSSMFEGWGWSGKQPHRFTAEDVTRYRWVADAAMWQRWVFDGAKPNA